MQDDTFDQNKTQSSLVSPSSAFHSMVPVIPKTDLNAVKTKGVVGRVPEEKDVNPFHSGPLPLKSPLNGTPAFVLHGGDIMLIKLVFAF